MVTVSESTSLDFCEYLWIIWNNELSYIMVEKLIDVKLITELSLLDIRVVRSGNTY